MKKTRKETDDDLWQWAREAGFPKTASPRPEGVKASLAGWLRGVLKVRPTFRFRSRPK